MILSVVYLIIVQHDSFITVYQLMVMCSDEFVDSFFRQLAKIKVYNNIICRPLSHSFTRIFVIGSLSFSRLICDSVKISLQAERSFVFIFIVLPQRGLTGLIEHSTPD